MTSPTAELRRRQRHREARRTILDAAGAILLEDDYEQFTMRKLASRCGYTAPTIYHHFGDKRGLIDAVLEEVFRGLVIQLKRVRSGSDPVDEMRAQFHAFVRFALRKPTHYQMLTTRSVEDGPPPSGEEAIALLERPLHALSESGRLGNHSIELVQQSFWALLHGLIALQTSRPDYEWESSLVDASLEAMISGLLREETPPVSKVPEASERPQRSEPKENRA